MTDIFRNNLFENITTHTTDVRKILGNTQSVNIRVDWIIAEITLKLQHIKVNNHNHNSTWGTWHWYDMFYFYFLPSCEHPPSVHVH